jgi:YVTN family beta-propeller protein
MAAMFFSTLLWMACGQVYRPVVIPTTTVPPNPANFHAVFSLNSNGSYDPAPAIFSYGMGTAFQIDVSGDTNSGVANMGINPTHAAILSNNSRVFVASAGSVEPGGADVVSSFTPAFASTTAVGLGTVNTFSLPAGSLPVFVNSTQTSTVYVANFGTNSVSSLNTSLNVVSQTVPVGTNPVSLATTSNGTKLYVANQGGNSVSSLNTVDLSQNTVTGFTGITPVWVVARGDSQKVYVLTQGDGNLVTIDTATDAVSSSIPVGAGANYISYDPHLQRLYVTNPATSTLHIFSVTGGLGDTPTLLTSINLSTTAVSGNYPTCLNPCPVSVAALPDGTRAYVASYQLSSCSDPTFSTSCKILPQVTVIDTVSNTEKTTVFPLPATGSTPPSVAEAIDCIPSFPYSPEGVAIPGTSALRLSSRFRMSTAAAADSSRVYVAMCDAGSVAIINTTTNTIAVDPNVPDTLVTNLPAPFGAGSPQPNGQPPQQSPVFLLTGQ